MGDLFHRWRHPTRCYAICAVARSGSHLLSDRLRASRGARRPKRFFYEQLEDKYGDQYGLDPVRDYAGYVRGIIAAISTPNAVFDFKLMGWNVKRLLTRLLQTGEFGPPVESEIDLLRSAFPRLQFIRLPRKTVLGNPMTVRQTDAISAEREERYRALAAPLPVSDSCTMPTKK